MSLPVKFSATKIHYFYIALALVAAGYLVAAAVRQSRYGSFMVAIRKTRRGSYPWESSPPGIRYSPPSYLLP